MNLWEGGVDDESVQSPQLKESITEGSQEGTGEVIEKVIEEKGRKTGLFG